MTIASDLRSALDPVALFEAAFGIEVLDWQRSYLRADDDVCLLKGRQIGASTASAALAVHVTRYRDAVNVVIVSPSLQQSKEVLQKARTAARNLGLRLVTDSASQLQLVNGSRIVSLPGTARSVRGWSAALLIIDEAAFVEDETFAAAAALVAATGGRVIYQSTPGDESGRFFEVATGSDAGWTRYTVRSDEVSTIPPTFLETERAELAPDEFEREYLCRFGRGSTRRLFSADTLARLFQEDVA